jgi:hypothetical protein
MLLSAVMCAKPLRHRNEPKRKLVRQIISEINSLDVVNTSELSIFSSPFTFYYFFFLKCSSFTPVEKQLR